MLYVNFHGIGKPTRDYEEDEELFWITELSLYRFLDIITEKKNIAITVDDSNSSDIEILFPALIQRNLKCTFFVLAGKIGQIGYLSNSNLETLVSNGMRIGSHGMHHRKLALLNQQDLDYEIAASKSILEDSIGLPITDFAIPFGNYNRRVLNTLKMKGYKYIYTSDRGVACNHEIIIPRNTVYAHDTISSFHDIISQKQTSTFQLYKKIKHLIKKWR